MSCKRLCKDFCVVFVVVVLLPVITCSFFWFAIKAGLIFGQNAWNGFMQLLD